MYFLASCCSLSFQLAASARARYSFCNSYNAVLIIILKRVEELKSQSESESQLEERVRRVSQKSQSESVSQRVSQIHSI